MSCEKPRNGEARAFWERQAIRLGSFRDASSTAYYLEGEQRLIRLCLPDPRGRRVLKLDLWNEVKNTNVLAWLARCGAEVFAVDISSSLVRRAAEEFRRAGLVPRFGVADLGHLPFGDDSFDFLYTMGTIEHSPSMEPSIREIRRVLRPGGTAVVGLPNRHDPFGRPAMVALMNALGVYPYGYEQSLSRGQLAALLRREGFEILGTDGVLFMPGALRMLELGLLDLWPAAASAVGALHWPFRLLARSFPELNKHGYLVAAMVRKPR